VNSIARVALLAICTASAAASARPAQSPPAKPPVAQKAASQNSQRQSPSAQSSKNQAKQQPEFNPMRAIHDVEVGKFYMKRGELTGAIARFKDAMLYKPHYAEARVLLGEAYEKNDDPQNAITYYKQYLEILPNTPESKKVRERMTALEKKLADENHASAAKNPQ
jgi:outer membrane protein assembly factor BamD (BamD/ComL family)